MGAMRDEKVFASPFSYTHSFEVIYRLSICFFNGKFLRYLIIHKDIITKNFIVISCERFPIDKKLCGKKIY